MTMQTQPPQDDDTSALVVVDDDAATEPTTDNLGSPRFGGSLLQAVQERLVGLIRGKHDHIVIPVEPEKASLGELALAADIPVADLVKMLSDVSADEEEVISSFDENKEHPIGLLVSQLAIIFCYAIPPVLSVLTGIGIGIVYSGGRADLLSAVIFCVCVAYEFLLVVLMLAIIKQVDRLLTVMGNKMKYLFSAGLIILMYVVIASSSALAQWVLYEGRVNMTDHAALAGAILRTVAVPVIDLVAAFVIPILRNKSLDKFISDIKRKTDGKIQIKEQKMQSQLDVIHAAMNIKATLQKEEDYQKKNDLANQLIKIFSDRALADAKKQYSTGDEDDSYGARRDRRR